MNEMEEMELRVREFILSLFKDFPNRDKNELTFEVTDIFEMGGYKTSEEIENGWPCGETE